MRLRRFPLPLIAVLAVAAPASAAMTCGTHLITEGDTVGELLSYCGEPTDVDRQTALRAPIIWRHGRPLRLPGGDIEVVVETWTYNLGPNKLIRRFRIEDGRVKEMQTLGYGYR